MSFTPIETLALIIALLSLTKLLVILVNPKFWFKGVVKSIYSNPFTLQLAGLILAGVSLFYLLQEFTIVQIFAVMFFVMSLMLFGVATYGKDLLDFADKIYKRKGAIRKSWLSILIWFILIIWVLIELF
tara:strand:+ start:486 stop:872 length:387 start_codon:yes stop_codon:yes gene_type:complete